MTTPQILAYRLGNNGLEPRYSTDAIAEFQSAMRKSLIDPMLVRDEAQVAQRLHEQTEARKRFAAARFYSARDASHKSQDIITDTRPGRKGKRFSITRDMLEGPGQDVTNVELRGNGTRVMQTSTVGHDRYRFVREADALRMMRIIDEKDLPDWTSDESVHAFMCKVYDMALEEAKSYSRTGINRIIDNAPGLYLFTELLKRSEKLVEEDFTELYARTVFPIMQLNTWLPQWLYERIDDRGVFPQTVDLEYLPSNAPRGQENRASVVKPLVYWHTAASWSNLELLRYAEAVANGAPNIQLDQRRINNAIRMMNWFENILAFFGSPALNIEGLFSPAANTGIQRIGAGGVFGSGTTEQDRELLTREAKLIIENTEKRLAPNTIMLGTKSWLYVTDKRYGDEANPNPETVLEAAEHTLRRLGVTEVMWVPEMGYRLAEKTRLEAHGLPSGEAERLAGGISAEQVMVTLRRDPEVLEMVVAKDRVMYPARETVNDRVEARMLQGGGGLVFYRPEAIKITTNVGP
jgi:hypothetical protein